MGLLRLEGLFLRVPWLDILFLRLEQVLEDEVTLHLRDFFCMIERIKPSKGFIVREHIDGVIVEFGGVVEEPIYYRGTCVLAEYRRTVAFRWRLLGGVIRLAFAEGCIDIGIVQESI